MTSAAPGERVQGGVVGPGKILASGPRTERLDELRATYGIATTTDNAELARRTRWMKRERAPAGT